MTGVQTCALPISAVEQYVARANKLTLRNNNLGYRTEVGNFEQVKIYDNNTATNVGSAYVVRASNTEVFIVNNQPTGSYNLASANLIGQSTGTSSRIVRYDHYTGQVTAANTNSITLALDANSANNVSDYNASVLFVVAGTGAGQTATITSYNPATRVAMISEIGRAHV